MLFATCVAARSFALADEPSSGVPKFALEAPHIDSGPPIFKFNGKDLTGFYTYTRDHKYADPKKVFTVVDGAVRISGEEFGGLATCGNFGNYHLLTEWKWGNKTWPPRADKARDSGILVHCIGPDGAAMGQWMESQECQIIEGGTGDFIMVPGLGKPSLTCEIRTGPDNQVYFEKGARPSPATRAATTGGAATRLGTTCSASGAAATSRNPPASGTRWTSSATATRSPSISTAIS